MMMMNWIQSYDELHRYLWSSLVMCCGDADIKRIMERFNVMPEISFILDWKEFVDFMILTIWSIGVWFIIDVM